jgi:hypothetical protein
MAACAAVVLSSCEKEKSDKNPYDKYAVDLGLSVKWASINVGASSEKDLGNYYGWGETSDKPELAREKFDYLVVVLHSRGDYRCAN